MDAITKVKAAAGAAWKAFFLSWGMMMFTYLIYLAMCAGWLDWLLGSGLYGPITREFMLPVTFCYIGAMKLITLCFLLGAAFLSMWWRGLRKTHAR
jgi:hypothetical protein